MFKMCPFCAMAVKLTPIDNRYYIMCDSCGVATQTHFNADDVILSWNRRPLEDKLRMENRELKNEVDILKKRFKEDAYK